MEKGGWFFLGLSAFWLVPFFPATILVVGVAGAVLSFAGRKPGRFLWPAAGMVWGILSVGVMWGISPSWKGERTFQGCLSSGARMGRTIQWVTMEASLDATRRFPVRIGIPVQRVPRVLGPGDCLSGTVTLSTYPDGWERTHLFGSAFHPVLLEGKVAPWDRLRIRHPLRGSGFSSSLFQPLDDHLHERILSLFAPDVAGVLLAMVLSDTSHLSPDLNQTFQKSGVYHMLSVSGEHMALLALFLSGTLFLTLRLLPYPLLRKGFARWPVSLMVGMAVVPVMGCYLLLIGTPLPALRAMGAFVLGVAARAMGVRGSWEDILGLSMIGMGILNPESPLSLSLDLSLSALWGVALFLRWGNRRQDGPLGVDPNGSEGLDAVVLGVFVTLTTLPLLWLAYRQLDWVGIVSNGIIVPVAGDLFLPAGFFYSLFLILFPTGWAPLTAGLEALGESVIGLVSFFSRIPHGQILLPVLSPGLFVIVFTLILGGLVVMARGPLGEGFRLLIPMGGALAAILLLLGAGGGPVHPEAGTIPDRALRESAPLGAGSPLVPVGEGIRWSLGQEENNWKWVMGR
ncbi:MAG: ComEC/Rec2 family competence protein [Leptospirales bacterium]